MAGDARRTLKLTRGAWATLAAMAIVVSGITLALVTSNRALEAGEERVLALALDAGKRGPQPPIVIDVFDRTPSHGELAREVDALAKSGAAAIGVLVPLDQPGTTSRSPDEEKLAIALRGAHHVAVASRLFDKRILLPPIWLARDLPSGIRDADVPRRGPLVRRLRRNDVPGTPQTMAAATFVALGGAGTEIDEEAMGRLPFDRHHTTPTIPAGAAQPEVRGKVVLVAEKVDDARPTADALAALLRVRMLHAVGADDAILVLMFAFAAGFVGFIQRPRRAAAFAGGLAALALVGGFVISMQGRPLLTLAATLAVPLAALPAGLARATLLFAQRAVLRRQLAQRTTRAVAVDLVAQPEHLVPLRRRVCVLVADLAERVGTNVGAPVDVVRAVEMHEQRVLEGVRHFGGIVDRFDGDRCVACFSMEGDGSGTLLAAQAALEIMRASGGAGCAVGLDVGEALCGLFGVDRRYRVQGEVVRRAARAARAAATRNVGVVATESVFRDIEPRLSTRPLGKESELLLFEIVGERRADDRPGEPPSDEMTIPR